MTLTNLAASILVLFFSLGHSLVNLDGQYISFIIALASTAVVITSASQYLLSYGKIAAEYEDAGSRYAVMNRAIERLTVVGPTKPDIEEIQKRLDELGTSTPLLPTRIWKRPTSLSPQIAKLEAELYERVQAI